MEDLLQAHWDKMRETARPRDDVVYTTTDPGEAEAELERIPADWPG